MKTLTLAEIHADPHCLDALIHAGEPVEFIEEGRAIARLTPSPATAAKSEPASGGKIGWTAEFLEQHRARMDAIWGDEEMMSEEESAAMLNRVRAERRSGLDDV